LLVMMIHVVVMAITVDGPDIRSIGHRAKFTDVILDQRAGRPPVNRDVIIAGGGANIVVDRPISAGVPAFTTSHIVDAREADSAIASVLTRAGEGDAG